MDIRQSIYDSVKFMHENYGEQIVIADISSQAYLSPSYFSSVFRILTGYTVKSYLNRYRLYRAAQELARGNKRIIEIAFDAGFLSQQSFTKSFSQTYGITPAQFRLLKPIFETFPPENIWKERVIPMELMDCFKNVRFISKDAFFVAGLEVDINYNNKGGTDPISGAWDLWKKNDYEIPKLIPDIVGEAAYGMTHSENAEGTAKYNVCVEVSTLDNLPVGLVGRRFEASKYAVFKTTLEILWSGEFWLTFYTKWLPESGYVMKDEQVRKNHPTFSRYPDIEVYDKDFAEGIMYIYAPVVKK